MQKSYLIKKKIEVRHMENYENIFASLIQKADSLGYGIDARDLTDDLLIKLGSNSNDLGKLAAEPKYKELNEQLKSYLKWSMPYLFFDDADSGMMQRDPKQEKEIVSTAHELLQEAGA